MVYNQINENEKNAHTAKNTSSSFLSMFKKSLASKIK